MKRCPQLKRLKISMAVLIMFAIPKLNFAQNDTLFFDSSGNENHFKWQHEYDKTLTIKLFMVQAGYKSKTKRKDNGEVDVFSDFEETLEVIKKMCQLSLGLPKIIYVVGWQYYGHGSIYPAFFKGNNTLKRNEDENVFESLKWLMEAARKYHASVSNHIVMFDAYEDRPLWDTYLQEVLISKHRDGELMVIGNYNNEKAYQIKYQNEWESGWSKKRIDSLQTTVPELKNTGMIHKDAWGAREGKGHNESLVTESEYQKKALAYWRKKNLDVTSEWVMDYMTGLISFAWHFNTRTQANYLNVLAKVYTCSGINPDIKTSDFGLEFLFGTSMHREDLWPLAIANTGYDVHWDEKFFKEFYLNCLQYFLLNQLGRKSVAGSGNQRTALFYGGVTTSLKDSIVRKDYRVFRERNAVLFPVGRKEVPTLVAYSEDGAESETFTSFEAWKYLSELDINQVGMVGLEQSCKVKVLDGKIK